MTNETRAARELLRNYRVALDEIRGTLAKLYERYAVNGVLTNAEMTKYNRMASLERQLLDEIKPALVKNGKLIERLTEAQYEESFYRHAWAMDQGVGVNLKWGSMNAEAVRAAVVSPLRDIAKRDLSVRAWNRLDRAVTQGIIRGLSFPNMMREVGSSVDLSKADTMRILRTEAHRARELGNYEVSEAAAEQGVVFTRRWVAALDDRTRASHAALDGQEVGLEERFSNGLLYPGDPAGDPAETINCRCDVVDVIKGYEPELRRTREEGIVPYQTFETWAKDHGVSGSRYGEEYNYTRR